MISPLSSSPDVTTAGEYVFRNYPSDGLKGKALGAYLQKAGYTKLAIISENTDFCQGIRSAVIKDLPQGISVVFSETVDPGARDFRTLLGRLKDTKFDVFLANAQSDAGVAEMAKQMRELGIKQPIVGTDTADSLTLVKLAGDAVEGLKPLSVPSLDEVDAMGGAFAKNFRAKNGEPKFGMFFAALSYDATKLLAETIGKAGTGENLKNALYNVKGYKGVSGTFSFDKNGDVVGIPFAMKEFKDGKLMQSELIPLQ
jgi:branched-chain amino acid transport system substrate-binding protein